MISDKLPQVNDFMKDILFTKTIIPNLPAPAMTSRTQNSTCGEIFKIYIDKKYIEYGQEVVDTLFMHEAGHIIFGHMKRRISKIF